MTKRSLYVDPSQDPGLVHVSKTELANALVAPRENVGNPDNKSIVINTNIETTKVYVKETFNLPGGSNSQVQINNAGQFLGDPGLTYNAQTDTLRTGSLIVTDNLTLSGTADFGSTLAGYATENYVSEQINIEIANLINSAPGTLDTLGEIATTIETLQNQVGSLGNNGWNFERNGVLEGPINAEIVSDYAVNITARNPNNQQEYFLNLFNPIQLGNISYYVKGVQYLNDGNLAVLGVNYNAETAFLMLLNTDNSDSTTPGLELWKLEFTGSPYGYGLTVDGDDNIYVTLARDSLVYVVKFDNNGNAIWETSLGKEGDSLNGYSLEFNRQGALSVVGVAYGSGNDYSFIAQIECTTGEVNWQKSISGTGDEDSFGIGCDNLGNTLVVGNTNDVGPTSTFLALFDLNGNLIWQQNWANDIDSGAQLLGADVAADSSGNWYVYNTWNNNSISVSVTKIDNTGSIIWSKGLEGTCIDWAASIAVDSSDMLYIYGTMTTKDGYFDQETFYGIMNTNGDMVNQHYFGQRGSFDTPTEVPWGGPYSTEAGQMISVNPNNGYAALAGLTIAGFNWGPSNKDALTGWVAQVPINGGATYSLGDYRFRNSNFQFETISIAQSEGNLSIDDASLDVLTNVEVIGIQDTDATFTNYNSGDSTYTFRPGGTMIDLPDGMIGTIDGPGLDLYTDTLEWVGINYNNQNWVYVESGLAGVQVGGDTNWYFNSDGTTAFPNYTFPADDGTSGQVLATNGDGTITWQSGNGVEGLDSSTFSPEAEGDESYHLTIDSNNSHNGINIKTYQGSGTNGNDNNPAIAIGRAIGGFHSRNVIAIGNNDVGYNSKPGGIYIGHEAGWNDVESAQGENSIAIGTKAARNFAHDNTITLNATGEVLDTQQAGSLFIKPIREDINTSNSLYYNTATGEVTYGTGNSGFYNLDDGTKLAIVSGSEIVSVSSELISGQPEFLTITPRSPDRSILNTQYGFDSGGMWFAGNNQEYNDGDAEPAYPIHTTNSFPADAKAVVTFFFPLNSGHEDPGICVYPADGVPHWYWDPHSSRIAAQMDGSTPTIYGLIDSVTADTDIDSGSTYQGRFTYDPINSRTTFEVLLGGSVVSTCWMSGRLPKGQNYRIGFDGDWDNANIGLGEKTYFTDLTITIGEDTVEQITTLTTTGEVKLPSTVKGFINLDGLWANHDDDIQYQGVTTYEGNAYMIGTANWNEDNNIMLFKYSLTSGELIWKKTVHAGRNAYFNISWTGGTYSLDGINDGGQRYQVNEQLFMPGYYFGGNAENGVTITVTDVSSNGYITAATISGTSVGDGSGSYYEDTQDGKGDPHGITYDTVNDQLVVLFSTWAGPGGEGDYNWDRGIIMRLSPDDGTIIYTTTLTDEGDVRPYTIDVSPTTGNAVVVGEKFNEFRNFGTLTMLSTGNGYFDILKSNLDPEYYPGTDAPNVYINDFWITGTGIASKEQVDGVNRYAGLTTTTRQGGGANFDVTANGAGGYTAVLGTSGGSNYLPGHKILISGAALGGFSANDATITVDAIDPGGVITNFNISGTSTGSSTYTGVVGSNIQVGNGCIMTLNMAMDGSVNGVYSFDAPGSNYVVGDVLTISGTQFPGGTSPANDIVMVVTDNSYAGAGGVNGTGSITGTGPTASIRIIVDGVDFTVSGGSWSMKENLGGEAFIWTPTWGKSIGGPTNDYFVSTTYSRDGNSIYAVGAGYYDVTYRQSLVVRFNAVTGAIVWSKYINTYTFDAEASGVAMLGSDIIVTGVEYNPSYSRSMTFVTRMSISGNVVWKKFYDNNYGNNSSWSDVQVDNDNNIYITKNDYDNDPYTWGNYGYCVTKLDQYGNIIWSRVISANESSYLGNWDGTRWSSYDQATKQLVVVGYTYAMVDDYYNGLWASFPADGFTYLGGEGDQSYVQQGAYHYTHGGQYIKQTVANVAHNFTPTPLVNNIEVIANAKWYYTQDSFDIFPQFLNKMVDENNGGLVFGDGSKQDFATNIIPQVRMYGNYYIRPTESGKHIYYAPNSNSGTVYIPYWFDMKLPVGFTFTIVNRCGSDVYVELRGGSQRGQIYGAGMNASSSSWGIPDSGSGSMVTLMKVEEGFDANPHRQGDVWMISGPSDIYTN